MERNDLDIPEETVWPATEEGAEVIELGPGDDAGETAGIGGASMGRRSSGEADDDQPMSLDPDRTQVDRNAASGGWDGVTEQVENDFESEQLRRAQDAPEDDADAPPLT